MEEYEKYWCLTLFFYKLLEKRLLNDVHNPKRIITLVKRLYFTDEYAFEKLFHKDHCS